MNRNLGVVQSGGVVVKSTQEDSESHQLKERSGLRYSVREALKKRQKILIFWGGG